MAPTAHLREGSLPITPLAGLFAVVAVTNLFSVPMAYLLNAEDFEFLEYRVTHDDVLNAYWWTIYAFLALVTLYYVLGIHRLVVRYQSSPMRTYSTAGYSRFWTITFVLGLMLVVLMFIQAGLRIPVLSALGQDYISYGQMRLNFERSINGTLFNVALYWVATSNLAIAWFHLSSAMHRVASVLLFLLIGSFDLARSPVGLALLMVLGYRLLRQRIGWKPLLLGVGIMSGLFLGAHYIAGAPAGYGGMGEYLGVRVFYGQWAGLPYYFSIFENERVSWTSLLGPALHAVQGGNALSLEGPSRIVMQRMSPEGIDDGTAGVASGFFIGEAYAVAGIPGVLLAPAFVMLQVLAIVLCFQRLQKTTLNMLLYSWFLFKVFMGIISGFSQFVVSFLQVMILVLVYWVMVSGLLTRAAASIGQSRLALRRR